MTTVVWKEDVADVRNTELVIVLALVEVMLALDEVEVRLVKDDVSEVEVVRVGNVKLNDEKVKI